MFVYGGTQVEPLTTDSEVQCEVTLIPTCSTPLCSPVKSVGCHSDDDNKDQDYIPSDLFSAEVMEEEEEEEKKSQKTEENERYKEVLSQLTCLLYTSPSPRDLSTSRMPSSA